MKNIDQKDGQNLEEWVREIAEGDQELYDVLHKVSKNSYMRGVDVAIELLGKNQPQ